MRKLGCFGLLIVIALAVAAFVGLRGWQGAGPLERPTTISIAPGTGTVGAARQLERAGAIRSSRQFRWFSRFLGGGKGIKAGEYEIPAHASASEILDLLESGKTLQRLVTVPEGWPSVMVADAINKAPELTGRVEAPREGSVLPDSYSYGRGDSRQAVLARMQKAMQTYLAKAWASRKPNIAVKTPEQALVLASIVEKETGKPSERRTVAAVYGNRLRQGIPLQADPTVIYPITRGRPLGRRIRQSELHAKNGYNTYASAGLPVGPIANPGRASIDAVLDPAPSKALYFVADGTGRHVFANTLAEHNANVQKWYAIRRSRGEM
ncbi:endolytic transglycosylase MltG [Sphingomonas aracearum]|uniref:Endolytic murein transglycosylase n=1 Tax=Sphingomonas aracearum TaxID=2283317 RepID=A0A369VSQ1_9SPHN|nr:endolytic transglycosylase MltG [Sphingomonas aracearum]RDE05418.1 endolytic transglycosylase MltG [Sphingomonas aracearum]